MDMQGTLRNGRAPRPENSHQRGREILIDTIGSEHCVDRRHRVDRALHIDPVNRGLVSETALPTRHRLRHPKRQERWRLRAIGPQHLDERASTLGEPVGETRGTDG